MSNKPTVVSVNISKDKGTVKTPVDKIILNEQGIIDDAHSGFWHRQVSLLSEQQIKEFSKSKNYPVNPGDFGENITVSNLDINKIGLLDRFQIGEVELEITQIGKACHGASCAIYREVGECIMPRHGLFARVIQGGAIQPDDKIVHHSKLLNIVAITLSDRAYSGAYQDQSGPKLRELLEAFFSDKRWHLELNSIILPDETIQVKKRYGEFLPGWRRYYFHNRKHRLRSPRHRPGCYHPTLR